MDAISDASTCVSSDQDGSDSPARSCVDKPLLPTGLPVATGTTKKIDGKWVVDTSYIEHRRGIVGASVMPARVDRPSDDLAKFRCRVDSSEDAPTAAALPAVTGTAKKIGGKWVVDTSYIEHRRACVVGASVTPSRVDRPSHDLAQFMCKINSR